jgi:hypothetical protein
MKAATLAACLFPLAASAAEPPDFLPLFNGRDLAGWSGDGYQVEDGAIVCGPQGGHLVSARTFADYRLDFEFRLPPGGNNGIGIHYPGHGDAAFTGVEVQLLDDSAEKHRGLKPEQFHGSLYALAAPARKAPLKPPGEWNRQSIAVRGDAVEVRVNDALVTRARLAELQAKFPAHAGLPRRSGHLAFCGHGDPVAFREIRIAEFPPAANEEAVRQAGFTRIFDGRSLAGWQLAAGSTNWTAHNGILRHDGKPGPTRDLWTGKEYGDFTLVFDWRWAAPGPRMMRPIIGPDGRETGTRVEVEELDSGIYLRGSSKAQVNLWNWPVGSGEVYGYRSDPAQAAEVIAAATPRIRADQPTGEWNRMMITLRGEKLDVTLNGRTVIDGARLPAVPARGRIALQHHGSAIDFANLWIKEL